MTKPPPSHDVSSHLSHVGRSPLYRPSLKRRLCIDIVLAVTAGICLFITLVPLGWVLYFVLMRGVGQLNGALLTQLPPAAGLDGGGIGNAILGTAMLVAIATSIAVPFGLMSAVYLSEFSQNNQIARWVRFFTNVLSGVPSIICGVFVYALLVQTRLTGYSAVAGGVALPLLMLPTIVRTTDEALQLIPQEIRWAAIGVGASRSQTVLQVVLPAAIPSILTGVMLAIGRAAGETAPLIFTALFSPFWPSSVLEPIASLSVLIYNFTNSPFEAQQQLAWAGSSILVLLVLIINVTARLATKQKTF